MDTKRRGLLHWLNASEIDEIDNAVDEGVMVFVVARGGCDSAFATFGEGRTPSIELFIGDKAPSLYGDRRNAEIIARGKTHEAIEQSFAKWFEAEKAVRDDG